MLPVQIHRHIFRFFSQPTEGIRQAHDEMPHLRDNLQRPVRFILADKRQIIRIFPFFQFVAGLFKCVGKQSVMLSTGADLEERIHPGRLKLLPDQMLTKGMDRADLHRRSFFRGRRDYRIPAFLHQTLPDFLFHLRSRRVGESNH